MKARCLPASLLPIPALLLASVLSLAAGGTASAQQPTDGVRVIDIKWILDHHLRYQADMAGLKKDFDAAAQRLQDDRQQIVTLEGRLKDYVPGSPDYKQLDEQVATRKAQWTTAADRQRRDIQNRESEILWQVYSDIQLRVKGYCEQHGVGLVIQFSGEQGDPRKPQTVVRSITKPIVYNSQDRDITFIILEDINRSAPPAPVAGGGGGGGVPVVPQGVPQR